MAYLDERGLRHRHPTVRSRVAYLFGRFVKAVKTHLHAYSEEMLKRIQDLLVIAPPVSRDVKENCE